MSKRTARLHLTEIAKQHSPLGKRAGKKQSRFQPTTPLFFSRDYFGRTGFIWKDDQVTGYYYEFPDGQRLTFPRVRE